MAKKTGLHFKQARLAQLEPAERTILQDYTKVLRVSRPLTETKKIYWLHRLPQVQARRKLIQHFLPTVVRITLETDPSDPVKGIQAGNLALIEAVRSGHLTPWDDLDYLIQVKIRHAVTASSRAR